MRLGDPVTTLHLARAIHCDSGDRLFPRCLSGFRVLCSPDSKRKISLYLRLLLSVAIKVAGQWWQYRTQVPRDCTKYTN